MDERFNAVIKKMEELISRNNETQKHIKEQFLKASALQEELDSKNEEQFSKARDFQKELDSKMETLNSSIDKALHDFESSSGELHSKAKTFFEKEISQIEQAKTDMNNTLKSLQDEYKVKVDNLIESIDNKSEEILKIYSELDNIRSIRKEANAVLEKIVEENRVLLGEWKKNKTSDTSLSGKVGKKLNRFFRR